MTIFTAARLAQIEPRIDPVIASRLAVSLEARVASGDLADLMVRAIFVGETAYETDGFRKFEENLRYTHAEAIAHAWPRLAGRASKLLRNPQALANAAYADHLGNGDEKSGDGWRYRGRGMLQLTGRKNYTAAAKDLGIDLVGDPDHAATPEGALETALWFWRSRGCGDAARAGDIDAVTRLINGPAMAGAWARRDLVAAARWIFI